MCKCRTREFANIKFSADNGDSDLSYFQFELILLYFIQFFEISQFQLAIYCHHKFLNKILNITTQNSIQLKQMMNNEPKLGIYILEWSIDFTVRCIPNQVREELIGIVS